MNRLARCMALVTILCCLSADAAWAVSCCIAEADTCHVGAACFNGAVTSDGLCATLQFPKDCGVPLYCPFDYTLGCLTADPCSAAKLTAASKAARDTLLCDRGADVRGTAVDPACASKASAALPGAFSLADARGPCPGDPATVQNDLKTFESNANTAVGNAAATRRASKCDGKKIAAMSRLAAQLLACESKAAMSGIDAGICMVGADRQFSNNMLRAIRKADCSSRNDLLDQAVDPFMTAVVDHLASPSGAFLADSTVF
jgi:hypothetical protein